MDKRKPAYWLFYRGFRVPSPYILVAVVLLISQVVEKATRT